MRRSPPTCNARLEGVVDVPSLPNGTWRGLPARSHWPKRKEIVAYCRGPYCLMSFDAVQLLRAKGLKARRLENGLPEWRLSGLPVEA